MDKSLFAILSDEHAQIGFDSFLTSADTIRDC